MQWVPKQFLIPQPQEPLSLAKIHRIATEPCWVKFQPLTVLPTFDGNFLIKDGHHRYYAAMKRMDITELPCVLLTDLSNLSKISRKGKP